MNIKRTLCCVIIKSTLRTPEQITNRMVILRIILFLLLIVFLVTCDQGIEPRPISEPTGFSGEIIFIGEWPGDIQRTHIVAFKDPLLSESDFNIFNLKYVSEEIPIGTQLYNYNSTNSAVIPEEGFLKPGEYSYIAVAQSKTPELSLSRADWFVAGVYYSQGDSTSPGKITVSEAVILEDINITCDFDNPPPQPPGGR